MQDHPQEDENPLQGYFDWQVTTLMLAHDLTNPIMGDDEQAHHDRRHQIEERVRVLTLGVVPEQYKQDTGLAWPPQVMMQITRATLKEAAKIAGL
ncbi:MAG: hypothetical protein AAGC44_04430 [Planctomycetota bacterium]